MMTPLIVSAIILLFVLIAVSRASYIVPQRSVFIVERLGKFHHVLHAGFHVIIPFIDRIAYKHSLKEMVVDVPMQICITRDNISVEVDGILYFRVMDPQKASYGINNYMFATVQLAQTTMRSVIGKLDLDQTFEERENINAHIVEAADKACDPWGIKVTRYEIKDIKPPQSIKDAMEKQMRAEREKRAVIAQSEGEKQAQINRAEAEKQSLIALSEGQKQKCINEASGRAVEIEKIADATAQSLLSVAKALQTSGGHEAFQLKVAEKYLEQLGQFAQNTNTLILPSNLSDLSGILASISTICQKASLKKPEEFFLSPKG
ncbi:MAG: SPFH/Band 7/PHB domain protein [Chlamydiae bacterium]|nr:SPFH/Band 7/PHB domain protein [Chlamydiota bacterium]